MFLWDCMAPRWIATIAAGDQYHCHHSTYPGCLLMVAASHSSTGPFEHVGVVEAGSSDGHIGDTNVFKDEDGSDYVIYDDTGSNIRPVIRLNTSCRGANVAKESENKLFSIRDRFLYQYI
jgi:hypothetical protein